MPATRAPENRPSDSGEAWFAGLRARGVVECVNLAAQPERVAAGGVWAVVGDFDGPVRAWRFAHVDRAPVRVGPSGPSVAPDREATWSGPPLRSWSTSLDRAQYVAAVEAVRAEIRAGRVYQATICRVLAAPLTVSADAAVHAGSGEPDAGALARVLAAGNPAPFSGGVQVPAATGFPPVWVVTASPELFLRVDGDVLTSAPIKGTGLIPSDLQGKDRAENVMITDLVRNDLQRVCAAGTVEVTSLLAVEHHPGLVHLVSTVQGRLEPALVTAPDRWARILQATYPPGSVSGAPKSSALRVIADLETVSRGPYCGVVGWIDADAGRAELAVGIRTFWWMADDDGAPGPAHRGTLRFGTGAGITWGSDPAAEWAETELKADLLIRLASARHPPGRD